MDRNRKILISILALMVFTILIAIVDITYTIKDEKKKPFMVKGPQFGPGVGVVRIEGPIGFNVGNSALGIMRGSEAVLKRLDEMGKNSNIRAVVIRINSPGGTVAATQEIYQKVWKLRKKNIPIVASLSEIAASGGYYVASACNTIMANQGSITGSIGVIAASPNLQGLFEKLGIKMTVIKSGKYKDILSSYRGLGDDERKLLQQLIDISYKKFLKDVALGRNMNQSDIRPYADGRVMTGETALQCKLIDGLGTFEDALLKAKELGGLSEDAPVYEELKTPFEELLMSVDAAMSSRTRLENHLNMGYYPVEYRFLP